MHLLERALEHGGEHLTHVVDLLLQLADFLLLVLLDVRLLLLELRVLVLQLFDLVVVGFDLALEDRVLVAQLLKARLVLPGHVGDDVSLTVVFFVEQPV